MRKHCRFFVMDRPSRFPHFDFSDTHVRHRGGQEQVTWRHLPLEGQEQSQWTKSHVLCYIQTHTICFCDGRGGTRQPTWQLYLASIDTLEIHSPWLTCIHFIEMSFYNCLLVGINSKHIELAAIGPVIHL